MSTLSVFIGSFKLITNHKGLRVDGKIALSTPEQRYFIPTEGAVILIVGKWLRACSRYITHIKGLRAPGIYARARVNAVAHTIPPNLRK